LNTNNQPIYQATVINVSGLRRIKDDMDKPLSMMRKNYEALAVTKKGWFWPLLVKSLIGIKLHKAPESDKVNKAVATLSSAWITYAGYVSTGVWFGVYKLIQYPWLQYAGWAMLVIALITSFLTNFSRLLTIGDSQFHIGAYYSFRRKEYEMLQGYLAQPHFSFDDEISKIDRAISDASKRQETHIDELNNLIQKVQILSDDKEEQNRKINALREQIVSYDELIYLLDKQLSQVTMSFRRAVDILEWIREPTQLRKENLHLLSDYSLYLVQDNELLRKDELGSSMPEVLDLDSPVLRDYSFVIVVKEGLNESNSNNIEWRGRAVKSYRFDIKGNTWVYNFHYEKTNQEISDIISTEEYYRFVNALLMLLLERNLINEGDLHGGTEAK
jgi:hypothetical protein